MLENVVQISVSSLLIQQACVGELGGEEMRKNEKTVMWR